MWIDIYIYIYIYIYVAPQNGGQTTRFGIQLTALGNTYGFCQISKQEKVDTVKPTTVYTFVSFDLPVVDGWCNRYQIECEADCWAPRAPDSSSGYWNTISSDVWSLQQGNLWFFRSQSPPFSAAKSHGVGSGAVLCVQHVFHFSWWYLHETMVFSIKYLRISCRCSLKPTKS